MWWHNATRILMAQHKKYQATRIASGGGSSSAVSRSARQGFNNRAAGNHRPGYVNRCGLQAYLHVGELND